MTLARITVGMGRSPANFDMTRGAMRQGLTFVAAPQHPTPLMKDVGPAFEASDP